VSAPGFKRPPVLVREPLSVEYTDATPAWLLCLLTLASDGTVLPAKSRTLEVAANIRFVPSLFTLTLHSHVSEATFRSPVPV
jgi:hypothetical protein